MDKENEIWLSLALLLKMEFINCSRTVSLIKNTLVYNRINQRD